MLSLFWESLFIRKKLFDDGQGFGKQLFEPDVFPFGIPDQPSIRVLNTWTTIPLNSRK